jgi:hypothetical protein
MGIGPFPPFKTPHRVTSPFNDIRIIKGKKVRHSAIDIVPKTITTANPPVYPLFEGQVISVIANWKSIQDPEQKAKILGGNMVVISHKIDDIEFRTSYLHLDEVENNIRANTVVNKDTKLGTMGGTGGNGYASHLHLGMQMKISRGQNITFIPVDPAPYLEATITPEKYNALELLKEDRRKIDLGIETASIDTIPDKNITPDKPVTRDSNKYNNIKQTEKNDRIALARTIEENNEIKRRTFGSRLPDIIGISSDMMRMARISDDSFDYLKRLL